MRTIREPARDVPIAREADVVVVGGGPAGFVAATAAARQGADVVLVERYGCLGGLATGGLVLYMDAIYDREGRRWIGGLPWETLERLRVIGGLAVVSPTNLHADSELLGCASKKGSRCGCTLGQWGPSSTRAACGAC
jgi:hypothetical protein